MTDLPDAAKLEARLRTQRDTPVNIGQLLAQEKTEPFLSSPLDAEPVMRYVDGVGSIVVGGGPENGGYSIELRETGENVVRYR